MKKLIILLGIFIAIYPTIIFAQKEYYDLGFEKMDTTGKSIVQWQYISYSMGTKYIIDSTNSATGKNCLSVKLIRPNEYTSYYFLLPNKYYKGLRNIKTSADIKMPYNTTNASVSFTIKKNKNILPYTNYYQSHEKTIMPFYWTSFYAEETIEEDPDEVLIWMSASKDRAWFDDIKIEINGKPINDIVFEVTPDK